MKQTQHFIIIGAGTTGLSLGYFLSKNGQKVTIVDKNDRVGGICSSFQYNDFILDIGPHKLYSQMDGMMPFFNRLLGEDALLVTKKNSLYIMDKYFSFPLKIGNLIKNISPKTVTTGIKVGLGAIPTFIPSKKPNNYEEHFCKGFGKPGYKLLFRDYARKVWGDPKELSVDIARKRVPIESIPKFITQMLSKKEKSKISADYFYYPQHGVVQLCESLAKEVENNKGSILLDQEVTGITVKNNKAVGVKIGKKEIAGDYVVSTAHIDRLADYVQSDISDESYEASKRLKYSALVLVYLFLDKKRAMDENWAFFLGKDVIFNRVSEQRSFSQFTVPENKTVICAEITVPEDSATENMTEQEIINRVKQDLKKVGILKDYSEIYDIHLRIEEDVYPVYDMEYKNNLSLILRDVHKIDNLLSIGRYGLFNYNNMDHCIDMGFVVGQSLLEGTEKSQWHKLAKRFDEYRIVD